jgi:hypothetical protein
MARLLLCVFALLALSANAPNKNGSDGNQEQQDGPAAQQLASPKPPSGNQTHQTQGCDYAGAPQVDCSAVSARAAVIQAEAAIRQARFEELGFDAGVATFFVAALAAIFARSAAAAARKSLDAFSEVEGADLLLTVENFSVIGSFASFNLVANNLGRSAMLIGAWGTTWAKGPDLADLGGFFLTSKPTIVPAGGRQIVQQFARRLEELRPEPFLWLLIETKAPLKRRARYRICYEIFTAIPFGHSEHYVHRHYAELPPLHEAASLWSRLRGLLARRG